MDALGLSKGAWTMWGSSIVDVVASSIMIIACSSIWVDSLIMWLDCLVLLGEPPLVPIKEDGSAFSALLLLPICSHCEKNKAKNTTSMLKFWSKLILYFQLSFYESNGGSMSLDLSNYLSHNCVQRQGAITAKHLNNYTVWHKYYH